MSVLRGFLWLLGFLLLGQTGVELLDLPMPSGVIGMLLLALWFLYRGRMNDDIVHVSQPLIAMLALLIMPGVVEIFFIAGRYAHQWPAILIALIVGTLLSVLSSLLLMRRYLPPATEAPAHE
ncbi:CidA/LrgA family protein [Salinicola avicenniae]|uniref:CidA/LrgA family protein n=1 Tax=Salinicola avicenniae TaxID=2916836 RepID=UPI0020741BA6|nr:MULTISPECIES: CidA/LrgA family protein [unclassified Salinicola]